MDDLLDLNWSAPSSSPKPTPPSSKPKDAFADLLSTNKPAEAPKLSLLEQQKCQQNTSPWLTPIQANTSIPTQTNIPSQANTPVRANTPTSRTTLSAAPSPSLSTLEVNKTTTSSFEDLLDPFGNKKPTQEKNTSLNQIRTQGSSTPVSQSDNDWDFDFLDTKATVNTNIANDPFDMESLVQQTTHIVEEDDNPLGILAEPPSTKAPSDKSTSPVVTNTKLDDDQEDEMMAHLIDMGFSLQESKFAIEATGGQDLQAAIDLLVQNLETAKRQQPTRSSAQNTSVPNKQAEDRPHNQTEKIVSQAQELGGFLYKNATSYFKAGREKVTKVVVDWQEQQRAQRLQEQKQNARPKWMTDKDIDMTMDSQKVERFADDDDDDDDHERQKRQREKAAAAHRMRQQEKARKETLISEDTYVSPSRHRRPNSGRSTPSQQNPSHVPSKPAPSPVKPAHPPAKPVNHVRTRPIVNASSDIMTKTNEARELGNAKFKLGQFGDAEAAYTRAIDMLPSGHDHLVLLCNNRAMTRLKIGEYKKCVEDCDTAIDLAKQSGDGSTEVEGVVIVWRDQIIKSLYRKAEALENIEKYTDALGVYNELVKLEGTGNPKINHGMARCRQALNTKKEPIKKSTPSSLLSSLPQQQQQQPKQDLMSMFDPNINPPDMPIVSQEELSKSKAVTAMRAKAAEQEAEEAERLEKTDMVNAKLVAWKAGKEQNLRALLATLDTLLWPGAQWKGAQMSELVNPKKCKVCYMKAIGKVHPDKLPSNVTVEQRMIASGIFAALNEAWDAFKTQNQM